MKKILLGSTVALATIPTVAKAAPIAGLIAGGLGLGTIGTAVLGAAISIGANWLIQQLFGPDEPDPQGIKQNMDSGGDNPISFIVGKYATPGKLVYVNTYGNDNKHLVMVINLSEVPVTALSSKLVVNGRVCDIDFDDTDAHGFARVQQYFKKGNDYLGVRFFNDPNSAPNFLTSNFGSDPLKPWTNDMVGKGCSYVVVRCRFSPDGGVWSGLPTFKFTVLGIPLYDIRKDSTAGGSGSHRWGDRSTHEFSENCAVINYNILRGIRRNNNTVYGGNASSEQLPYDIWAAAMNTCDENVPKKAGGTLKRFKMGAEISVDIPPLDIIREVNNSCSGWTNEFGGIWKMFVGAPGASVTTITDDDVIVTMDQTDDLFKPLQETYNVAQGSYPEPESSWEMKDAPTRYFQNFIDEDGEELSLNMEFPFVWERNQVQRLMKAAIKESRRQRTHTIVLPPAYAMLEVWDVITWNSGRNGYVGKEFLVVQKEDLLNCCQQVTIREYDWTDFDWDAVEDEFDSYDPTTDTPDPETPVQDFTVTADYIDRPAAGKDKPAILVEWTWADEVDLNVRTIQWRIRRAGKTKIIGKGEIRDYEDGEELITHRSLRFAEAYEIQFRIVPRRKQDKSEWGDWKPVTMLAIDVPANFSIVAQSKLGGDGKLDYFVKATWDEVDQANNGYGIKYTIDGEDFYERTDGNRFRFPVKAPSSVTVQVRARASDGGSPGAYTTPLVLNVTKKTTAPTTPTSLTVVGKHRRAVVKLTEHPDADFKRWNVYYSKTNNFTTGVKSQHGRSNRFPIDDLDIGDTYYFWVTAEDTSGNESSKYPASNTAGVSATIVKIDDDDTPANDVLAAPSALTLTKIQEEDEEGTIRTYIELNCTPPGWETDKTTYVYSVTVGAKEFKVKSDGPLARFRVQKTGVLHTVKVRAVKGVGTRSVWGSNSTITPAKKATGASTATGLTVVVKPKGLRPRWTKCSDVDYKESIVYRGTSSIFGSAVEIDRITGTSITDNDELTEGTTYWYFVAHMNTSGVIGSPSSGASAVWRKIDDTDTPDNDLLSAPTALTLTKIQDKDEEGTIRTYIDMSCTAPGWVTPKTDYVFEITVGTKVYTEKSEDRFARFRVNKTGVLHSVRVRAVKGIGNRGAWSSASTITPSKKSADAVAITGLTITRKGGNNVLKWDVITDPDNREVVIYKGTSAAFGSMTAVARTSGTRWVDHDSNTKGTRYHYRVVPVDTSGNVASSVPSSSVDDLETGIVLTDTDQTWLAAPSGVSLTQANRDVDKDGTVDIALLSTFSTGVTGAGGYEVEFIDSNGQTTTVRADGGKAWFKANASGLISYRSRWRTLTWNNQPEKASIPASGIGAWSAYVGPVTPAATVGVPATPSGAVVTPIAAGLVLFWTAPTELDYAYTEIALKATNTTPASTDIIDSSTSNLKYVFYPNMAARYVFIRHVNTSGLASSWLSIGSYSSLAYVPIQFEEANHGTSGGNISVTSAASKTKLTATWKCTSNTSGITVTLGSKSYSSVVFTDGAIMSITCVENGGGTFSLGKSGGGTWGGVVLVAEAIL